MCAGTACIQAECCLPPQICATSAFNSDAACEGGTDTTAVVFNPVGDCAGLQCTEAECCVDQRECTASAFSNAEACIAGADPGLSIFDAAGTCIMSAEVGLMDLDVCSTVAPAIISAATGTIHDVDISDDPVDCTLQVCSCGRGHAQNEDETHCHIGYGDNLDCGKHIRAPAGQVVNLVFRQFNIEPEDDFVYIYDGPDASAPRIGRFTGYPNPPSVSTTGRDLFFRFTTDHGNIAITANEDPGFYADWHFSRHLECRQDECKHDP